MDDLDNVKTEGELAQEAENKAKETAQQPEGSTPKEEPAKEPEPEAEPSKEEPKPEEKPTEEKPAEVNPEYGKPGHTPQGVQKRINQLTRENRELKDSYGRLESEFNDFKNRMNPQREPTKEDFLKAGKTEQDYMNFVIDKRSREVASKMLKDRDEELEFKKDLDNFNASVERARNIFPDYDEVVYGREDIPATARLSKVLRKMENGGDVLYTLQKNDALRKQFIDATTEDAKERILTDVSAKLKKLYEDAMKSKTATTNQQQATPAPAPAPEAPRQAAQPQIREPGELGKGSAKKKLDPSKCSMDEWMTDGF